MSAANGLSTSQRYRVTGAIQLVGVLFVAGSALACKSEADTSVAHTSTRNASAATSSLATADSQRVVLTVKGMYCASCERTVVTMLRRTAGVLRAEVSVERGEARVSYDSTRTSPAQLVQIVKSLGYGASVKST